jgi:hypothetical protein
MNIFRDKLKQFAAEQAEFKAARKTGSRPTSTAVNRSNAVNGMVHTNRPAISALLDVYHEVRGTKFHLAGKKHGNYAAATSDAYIYNKWLAIWRENAVHNAVGSTGA